MKSHWFIVIDTLTDQYVCKCATCGEICPVGYVRCPCCKAKMENGTIDYKEKEE